MVGATFAHLDLTTLCRLDDLGLRSSGSGSRPTWRCCPCRVTRPDRRCGCNGVRARQRHPPAGKRAVWRPMALLVTLCRYRCSGCGHVWRQDPSLAAEPRAKLTRGALRWALTATVCRHLTVARVAGRLEHRQLRRPGRRPRGADQRHRTLRRSQGGQR